MTERERNRVETLSMAKSKIRAQKNKIERELKRYKSAVEYKKGLR